MVTCGAYPSRKKRGGVLTFIPYVNKDLISFLLEAQLVWPSIEDKSVIAYEVVRI